MPKFVTIGYGDQAVYERTAPEVRDAAHAHDDKLREHGALIGIAGAPRRFAIPKPLGCKRKMARLCRPPFLSLASP